MNVGRLPCSGKKEGAAVNLMKKILQIVLLLLIPLLCIEGASFLFFRTFGRNFSLITINSFLITEERIPVVKRSFNAGLGWKIPADTPYGERPRARKYPDSFMATFGDSFTYCDEVKDTETWQEYLSEMLSRSVINLGNSGYGTDQALLRFREDFPKVRTPLVTLGINTENILRIVNNYRKFLYVQTGIPLTKPMFRLVNGGLTLVENPLKSADEIEKLRDPGFIRQIGSLDYWYRHQELPRLQFPYCGILFNRFFWKEVALKANGKSVDELHAQLTIDPWEDPEAVNLMFAIIDAFAAEALQQGAVPLIMLMPQEHEVLIKLRDGRHYRPVSMVSDYCARRNYLFFNGVDALAAEARSPEDVATFYINHASAKGNQLIAKHLYRFLSESRLVPGGRTPSAGKQHAN
jgi:hypothetical protein